MGAKDERLGLVVRGRSTRTARREGRWFLLAVSIATTSILAEDDTTFTSHLLHERLSGQPTFSIAVFPMQNVSVDAEVAYHFRQRVNERLVDLGYSVVDGDLIDSALYGLGLTHADQLSLVTLEDLAGVTHADAFMFGLVEEASTQHAIAYNAFTYKSSLRLQHRNGDVLWQALERKVTKRRFSADPINAFLDVVISEVESDSRKASWALADQLLTSLPRGPVHVLVGDDLLSRAVLAETNE